MFLNIYSFARHLIVSVPFTHSLPLVSPHHSAPNSNLAINYLNFTINSGDTDTTTMNYPASKDKNSLKVLGIAFYRNAVWNFDGRVGSIALTNDNITFLLSSGYDYAKGLPAFILYN